MGYRRLSREFALQVLYLIEMSGEPIDQVLDFFWRDNEATPDVRDFSSVIVRGTIKHKSEIDEFVGRHSSNWRLTRMAVVDRNLLRLAVYELIHEQDVPVSVILNEAIEVAKKFGTEDSSAFVNGILDNIAKEVRK